MTNTRKTSRSTARGSRVTLNAPLIQNTVALTLKIDRETYKRLVALRATGERLRTHQEILRQALEEYLEREGA